MIDVIVCETIEEVNEQIRRLEVSTQSKYVVHGVDKGYSIPQDQWRPTGSRVRVFWERGKGKDSPLIPFDGIPFVFVGRKMLGCHRGKDKHAKKKQRYADKRDSAEQEGLGLGKKGRRNLLIKTKKLSCPALIGVTRIAKFPAFKLDEEDRMRERERRAMSCSLRHALQTTPGSVQWKDLYFIRVPSLSDHVGHPIGEAADEVDDRVRDFIKEKVKEGVTKVKEIKRLMVQFVQDELFPESTPPQLRVFFPKEKTLRSIMNRARKEMHFTKIDLANLLALAESWKQQTPKNNFLLRVQSESENLLLCYQTDWQQALLQLFGREVCFLDAAYRRTRFPLPLYFLCARSSVCLVAVGLFVVQNKSDEALVEALGIFKQWNPSWNPSFVLTEDCPKEMVAVEQVFTDCQAVFNDYLRERSWAQWLCNGNRSITNHTEILQMMCAVAGALDRDRHQEALRRLEDSCIWKRPLFKDWFTSKWLTDEKRWASAVRADVVNFVSLMNQGIGLQRTFFSHKPLREHKEKNLSEMLQFLVGDYLPQMFMRYTTLTSESSSAFSLNPLVPPFLWNRPKDVVVYVMDKMEKAVNTPAKVEEVGEGTFRVWKLTEEHQPFTVQFGSRSRMPSCDCEEWRSHRLPCEHFCQVFSSASAWGWESLCPQYRNHFLLSFHVTPPTEAEDAITEIIELMSPEPCSAWVESKDAVSAAATLQAPCEVPSTSEASSTPQVPLTPPDRPTPTVPSTPQCLSTQPAPSVPQMTYTPPAVSVPQALPPAQAPLTKSTMFVTATPPTPSVPQTVTTTLIPIKLASQTPQGTKTILVPIASKTISPQMATAPPGQAALQIQTVPQTQTLPMILTNKSSNGTAQFVLVTQAPLKLPDVSKSDVKQPTVDSQTVLSAAELLCQKDELQSHCVSTLRTMMDDVSRIKDINHLKDLRQKLDMLQKQIHAMVPKTPSPPPLLSTEGPATRKRSGVEIILAMPKRIRLQTPAEVEHVNN